MCLFLASLELQGEKKASIFFFSHNKDPVIGDEKSMYEGNRSVGFHSN